jgi:hypothetical protein
MPCQSDEEWVAILFVDDSINHTLCAFQTFLGDKKSRSVGVSANQSWTTVSDEGGPFGNGQGRNEE